MHPLKLLIWHFFLKKRFHYVSTTAFIFFFWQSYEGINTAQKKNLAEHLNETLLCFFSESVDNKQDVNKYNKSFHRFHSTSSHFMPPKLARWLFLNSRPIDQMLW